MFSALLLAWYDQHRRILPFRGTKDPYRIWVSEIMLQQTRTETVGAYYQRFLLRFPDVFSLADAPEQEENAQADTPETEEAPDTEAD